MKNRKGTKAIKVDGYSNFLFLNRNGLPKVAVNYHAMERAVAAGKIRSIGLSNWYVEELEAYLPPGKHHARPGAE